eukprot:TRINITY_DN14248_c0_g1_i1.p1 TRINITY_DN14248_c0_g1~~TRINITY_DN14248_c0_g1_i1.p1  ORF type:complete len:395 (+),score=38.78 TRINITY_DN14248_c0_g1_i1:270-1454(+)
MSAASELVESLLRRPPNQLVDELSQEQLARLHVHIASAVALSLSRQTPQQVQGITAGGGHGSAESSANPSGGGISSAPGAWLLQGHIPLLLLDVLEGVSSVDFFCNVSRVCRFLMEVARGEAGAMQSEHLRRVAFSTMALSKWSSPHRATVDHLQAVLLQPRFANVTSIIVKLDEDFYADGDATCSISGTVRPAVLHLRSLLKMDITASSIGAKTKRLRAGVDRALYSFCPNLRVLHLSGIPNLSGTRLLALKECCCLLEELWLIRCAYEAYQPGALDLYQLSGLHLRELRLDEHNFRNPWILAELPTCLPLGSVRVSHYRSRSPIAFGALKDTLERLSVCGLFQGKLLPECVALFVESSSCLTKLRCNLPAGLQQRCRTARRELTIISDDVPW